MKLTLSDLNIAVIGLGYVGLPLALAFSRKFNVIGYDVNPVRIRELKNGNDTTLETSCEELSAATNLSLTFDSAELRSCNCFIVTVPTPIDKYKRPDLTPLLSACRTVGTAIKKESIIIFESTVYPGCTEEECVPAIEHFSSLKYNEDFFCGYSPERINPGDKTHRLETITKITSGSTPQAAELVDTLYKEIVTAGTYKAESIKVAEAAKVIENTQRDLNIALVNEVAILFNILNLDTNAVLSAASTKWNFLPFKPGLVGGHCIGVDPYYLTHKAQSVGYHPELILAGRRINDGMGSYVAQQLIKALTTRSIRVAGSSILVMGLTFKENCPDLRNTRIVDVVKQLTDYGCNVDVYDPWVSSLDAEKHCELKTITSIKQNNYDAIIIAVAHSQFKTLRAETIRQYGKEHCVIFDIKGILEPKTADLTL